MPRAERSGNAGAAQPPQATAGHGQALTRQVRTALYKQYEVWQGVPYRFGGTDSDGIDCSAFVVNTFADRFDLFLPRTTRAQAKLGHRVPRKALRLGDLVFFKTGRNQRHVGIYVGAHRFMHASTSDGVTVSSLRNPYWAGHYWQARRLLTTQTGDPVAQAGSAGP